MSHAALQGVRISVDAPAELPPRPAAVEVAAYRIAQEALTNVLRHAQCAPAPIHVTVGEALELEVSDDGRGVPSERWTGVG